MANHKTFCIVAKDPDLRDALERLIMTEIEEVEVKSVTSIGEAEGQVVVIANAPSTPMHTLLNMPTITQSGWILIGLPQFRVELMEEAMLGKVQFLDSIKDENALGQALKQAYQFSLQRKYTSLKNITLEAGETLFQEGDRAQSIFLLRTGKLEVFRKGSSDVIGAVHPGEFVGEMAYLNDKPRSASVRAAEVSELTDIPVDQVDAVLMDRPVWSKKMLQTLSKRLQAFVKDQ